MPLNIAAISSGNGNLGSVSSLPNNIASNSANLSASALVESIVTVAVGFKPATATGVVVISHEKVIASGLSLTVAYAFSDGAVPCLSKKKLICVGGK